MTARRLIFWMTVGLNALMAVLHFVTVALAVWSRRPVLSRDVAGFVAAAAVAYVVVIVDELTTAQIAIYTAQRRCAEAQMAMHEDLAAKIKRAHVDVSLLQGDGNAEGLRH